MKFTESQLKSFASPLSETEEQKCKNAIRMVSDAMKLIGYTDDGKEIRLYESDTYSYALDLRKSSGKKITLLVQGSYANNTNVRTHSDVDIAVILESTFLYRLREGAKASDYGITEGTSTVQELKEEVLRALNLKFRHEGVERRDKSIKVHGNNYRVDSDVVPAYRFRDYRADMACNIENYVGGITIRPDSGGEITNFPEQHIKNGRVKNTSTKLYFKKHVRILKKLRYIMQEYGYKSADTVSSFGLESLLWNVPDDVFTKYSAYRYTFDEIVSYLNKNTSQFPHYTEANGIKPLFPTNQDLRNYMGFISDLTSFYEYDIVENS